VTGDPIDQPASLPVDQHGDRPILFGPYRVERLLGRGAMSAVYLAHDAHSNTSVAVKTMALNAEFDDRAELAEARERFFREAQTAGRLRHRGIVRVLGSGEDHGLAYLAMEYLRGCDLQASTHAAALLPLPVVLHIGEHVADALAHAHRHGVVHRDIKPANVMLDAATGVVKVTDFGIARIAGSNRTRTGMVLGTPSYMSPEQLSGRRVDGRADLYSLGVMLFQLLTGELPHRAESMAKLMYAIANEAAPDVRSVRADVPAALAALLANLLVKPTDARCADGLQWANEVRDIAAQWPVPSWPMALPVAPNVQFSRDDPGHNSGPSQTP
jgi:eukaryotic-like serine/threonine-protein kinase